MITRIVGLATGAAVVGLMLACSPDRTPKIPPGTPECAETCTIAWECGGVLENDLDGCINNCNDEDHGNYRICVADTTCEEMYECKIYAPSPGGAPVDTDAGE